MRRSSAGSLTALALCGLAGCFSELPSGGGSDAGSLFDVGLADVSVDFDTGSTVTPPDGSDDATGSGSGEGSGGAVLATPTLTEVADALFTPACGDCHIAQTLSNLWLAPNAALRDRLLASSLQAAPMPLITPGDLEASYLWRKVAGTHRSGGGLGEVMPLGRASLTVEQTELLRRWISAGAPP